MCLEIHNFTLYKGMSDRLYRTIDKEVGRALLKVDQAAHGWPGSSRSDPWRL